jgi:hypothetical protein
MRRRIMNLFETLIEHKGFKVLEFQGFRVLRFWRVFILELRLPIAFSLCN